MTKINSCAELLAEYPWLIVALAVSSHDALIMAYRTGRLDGGLAVLEKQAIANEIEEFEHPQMKRRDA